MKKNSDFALLLLEKARKDIVLIQKIGDDVDVSDEVIGFHAQQAIEKSLKALLLTMGVQFRRTHDIRELLDLIKDNGNGVPSWFEGLDAWTPFAVEYRYEELPEGIPSPIDRRHIAETVGSLVQYVEKQCKI